MRAWEFLTEKKYSLDEGLDNLDNATCLCKMPTLLMSKVGAWGDRIIVIVKIDSARVPFYIITGGGGKKNVPVGNWYPFFGIGKDMWINKGSEEDINNFYGSQRLKNFADLLNNKLGNLIPQHLQIPQIKGAIDVVVNVSVNGPFT